MVQEADLTASPFFSIHGSLDKRVTSPVELTGGVAAASMIHYHQESDFLVGQGSERRGELTLNALFMG